MSKPLSKTLATEIAERALKVVNPANRALTMNETLRRHGFAAAVAAKDGLPGERAALVAWLLQRYRG